MKLSGSFSRATIFLGFIVLIIVFALMLVIGGGAAYFLSNSSNDSSGTAQTNKNNEEVKKATPSKQPAATKVKTTVPTKTEPATQEPTRTQPTLEMTPTSEVETGTQVDENQTSSSGGFTGNQNLTETSLFDDFSSNALGWPVVNEEKAQFKIENGTYTIQLLEPGNLDYGYFPVDFPVNEISFDVKAASDQKDGFFGVFCNIVDKDNLYFVEFDLAGRLYKAGEIVKGDDSALSKSESGDGSWLPAEDIKSPPTDINHIAINCSQNKIDISINETPLESVTIKKPLSKPGRGAFFLSTAKVVGKDGYKVQFDNVDVSQSGMAKSDGPSILKPITEEPANVEVAGLGEKLPGKQRFRDNDIFDDFSSNFLGWSQADGGKTIFKIEDEAFSIQVLEPGSLGKQIIGSSFNPMEISFDVWEASDTQQGRFGVFCQQQDDRNKYYIEFNLENKTYVIAKVKNGKVSPLTKPNPAGGTWLPAEALKSPPTTINHIDISCYLDNIALTINGTLVEKVDVTDPLEKPGNGAIYAATGKEINKNGYKVFFDNMRYYEPEGIISGKAPASKPAGPADSVGELSGKQKSTDYYLFDDFSSNAFKWYIFEKDTSRAALVNQTYSLQSIKPDSAATFVFPVDFVSNEISFDVKGSSNQNDGSFGVVCEKTDGQNYYYVEFDLTRRLYAIGEYKGGEFIFSTKKPNGKNSWVSTNAIKSPATSNNHIAISCYLDSISLFINDTLVEQIDIKDPLEVPGRGQYYITTTKSSDKDGYTVLLDNVEIYQPQQ